MTIRAQYESGCTIACLSARYKRSQKWIHRQLRREGTIMRPPGPQGNRDRILELGKLGWRPTAIGRELDCTRQYASFVLCGAGIRFRRRR
ncbi:MAG: hypothetical protein KGO96_12685 [Elusimicrobia bacterium]|nr:hypothetical protein [Elusimicrobiota bacterium]